MIPEQLREITSRLDTLIEGIQKPVIKIYTITEVAELLKISNRTVNRAIKDNQLRPSKIGDWRITEEQLNEWLESRRPKRKK